MRHREPPSLLPDARGTKNKLHKATCTVRFVFLSSFEVRPLMGYLHRAPTHVFEAACYQLTRGGADNNPPTEQKINAHVPIMYVRTDTAGGEKPLRFQVLAHRQSHNRAPPTPRYATDEPSANSTVSVPLVNGVTWAWAPSCPHSAHVNRVCVTFTTKAPIALHTDGVQQPLLPRGA